MIIKMPVIRASIIPNLYSPALRDYNREIYMFLAVRAERVAHLNKKGVAAATRQ